MPKVIQIIAGTAVDGPGLRTSVYFAGCHHHCPGCHNPQSWDFTGGTEMTPEEIMKEIELNGFNVTFSGGDPMAQADDIIPLAAMIRDAGYTIWCYTGYLFEEVTADRSMSGLLSYCDVLVDGRFDNSQRDISLRFRGSTNQRLIDIKASIEKNEITLWNDDN